jgi:hypothetical protein
MFDNPVLFLKLFGIGAAIALIVYRIQVFKLIASVLFGDGNKKNSRVSNKVNQLLLKHSQKANNQEASKNEKYRVFHPKLKLLKMIKFDSYIVLHYVNKGDEVTLVNVSSSNSVKIDYEPKTKLGKNGSGFIKIYNSQSTSEIKFKLLYSDKNLNRNRQAYKCNIKEATLSQI